MKTNENILQVSKMPKLLPDLAAHCELYLKGPSPVVRCLFEDQ